MSLNPPSNSGNYCRRQPRFLRPVGLVMLAVLISVTAVFFVGGFGGDTASADTESEPFEERLWSYLIGNNYKNWAPAPGQTGDFYTGQSPHGALLKCYMNRTAIGDVKNLRPGSVVILEDYRSDRSLKTISVMYRTEGFNPGGNDWYWVAYHPDGSVVQERRQADPSVDAELAMDASGHSKIMGKATTCISCHQNATDTDFAFFNDGNFGNIADRSRQKSDAISTIR